MISKRSQYRWGMDDTRVKTYRYYLYVYAYYKPSDAEIPYTPGTLA